MSGIGRRPMSAEESQIIVGMAGLNFSAASIVFALREKGFYRDRHTVRNHMVLMGVAKSGDTTSIRRREASLAHWERIREARREAAEKAAAEKTMSSLDAIYGTQRYTDHPGARRGSEALLMCRPSASQYMTTGGVAVYG